MEQFGLILFEIRYHYSLQKAMDQIEFLLETNMKERFSTYSIFHPIEIVD